MAIEQPTRVTELRSTFRFVSGVGTRGRRLLLDAEVVELRTTHGLPLVSSEICAQSAVVGGGIPQDLPDPARLPDGDVATDWGAFVTDCLCAGIGEARVGEILARSHEPGNLVRLVFRALEPEALRVPFETVVWPPRSDGQRALLHDKTRNLSVVRTADELHRLRPTLSLAPWDPGRYEILVLIIPGSRGDADLAGILAEQPANQRGDLAVVETTTGLFAGATDDLRRRVRSAMPDLLILKGHGERGKGLDASAGPVAHRISGGGIAKAAEASASAVVLAMCGSAAGGEAYEASDALQVARTGVPVVLGFQAAESESPHVDDFVGALLAHLRDAVITPGQSLSLLEWEHAVRQARAQIPVAALTPVIYVNPGLCLSRGKTLEEHAPEGRTVRPMEAERVVKAATATPFYVPGQVTLFREGGRVLRVPLPVDVGTSVEVELHPRTGSELRQAGSYPSALREHDLEEILARWGLRDSGLIVTLTSDFETRAWAARTAEFSAVLRGLADILEARPPDGVLDLLDEHVAAEWGAHDAAPRVVGLDGRRVARFQSWPPLIVRTPRRAPVIDHAVLVTLQGNPPVAAEASADIGAVERALSGDLASLKALLAAQRNAVRARPSLPAELAKQLSHVSDAQPVLLPAFAFVDGYSRADAPDSDGMRRIRHEGAGLAEATCDDVLR